MIEKNVSANVSGAGFVRSLTSKLVKRLRQEGVSDEEIQEILRRGEESDEVTDKIADAIAGVIRGMQTDFTRVVSICEGLMLDAVNGAEVLANASDFFDYVDEDFKKWSANKPGLATEEMPVCVYEMASDATFAQIFGSLAEDVRKLCLTQAQIKNFVRKHHNWLRTNGYETYFLFESNEQFFIAGVQVYSGFRLKVNVYRFGYSYVWYAKYRRRVVVPQLNSGPV